jgi:predicted CopG family antitoxin
MKRMILLTFDPSADVYYPLVELLGKEDVSEVLIPVITRGIFTETAINAVKEQGVEFQDLP